VLLLLSLLLLLLLLPFLPLLLLLLVLLLVPLCVHTPTRCASALCLPSLLSVV
jgi:hypothetical protein